MHTSSKLHICKHNPLTRKMCHHLKSKNELNCQTVCHSKPQSFFNTIIIMIVTNKARLVRLEKVTFSMAILMETNMTANMAKHVYVQVHK